MKKLLIKSTVLLLTVSCGNAPDIEQNGYDCLRQARTSLGANDFKIARRHIETLRNDFPLALNAREEGILLLDSIYLFEAQMNLNYAIRLLRDKSLPKALRDSTLMRKDEAEQKMNFFSKKLEHDKKNQAVHPTH
ncbi:MAG: hypothetical protein RR386_08080 [Bacteroidaceae bacterium]